MAIEQAADTDGGTVPNPTLVLAGRARLFRDLAPQELAEVMGWLEGRERRPHAPGDVIIRQTQEGERCYLILSGKVQVTFRHDPESPSQVPIRLATLNAGDFFGEMSILDGRPCSATVTAVCSTNTIALTREELLDLLLAHPQVAISMLATISGRLRDTEAMLPVPWAPLDVPHAEVPW